MRRPKAPRRLRAGAFDRRMAASAFTVAAVALLCTAGAAHAPKVGVEVRDPVAARDLVRLMQSGERGSWSVGYDFTRTLSNGRVLHQSMQEGRNRSLHVLRSGTSMTIQRGRRSYDCNLVEGRWPCTESAVVGALPASEVMRVAIAVGAYNVTPTASMSIAGEHARCFRVLATGHGSLPDIGTETDMCLASDGVALSSRVVRTTGDVDQRVARSVARHVSTAAIAALAPGFDPNRGTP